MKLYSPAELPHLQFWHCPTAHALPPALLTFAVPQHALWHICDTAPVQRLLSWYSVQIEGHEGKESMCLVRGTGFDLGETGVEWKPKRKAGGKQLHTDSKVRYS